MEPRRRASTVARGALIRRLCTLLLLFAGGWGASAAGAPEGEKGDRYQVGPSVRPCLNLRQFPTTGAPILDCLEPGTVVTRVYGITGWIKAAAPGGTEGWLAVGYLRYLGEASAEAPHHLEEAAGGPTIVAQRLPSQKSPAAERVDTRSEDLRDELSNARRERDLMAANLRRTKAKLEEQQAAVEALRESSADRIAALEAQLEDARDLAEIGDQTDEALRALLRDAEAANAELRGEIATLEAARLACEAERRSSMEPPAENQLTGPATAEAAATEGPRSAPPEPLPLTVESRPAPDIELAIDTLFAWAEAWSRQSVDDYLSFYSRAFQPPGYESLAEWQAERRDRLIRPSQIEISLSAVQAVFLGEGRVSIRFRQRYRSTSYEDSVVKEMVMEWTDGVWKILRESVVDVLESP